MEKKPRLPLIDLTPNLHWVTQALHASLAVNIFLATVMLGYAPRQGFFNVVIWAAGKDGIWDLLFEETTWWLEAIDFCFYAGAGALLLLGWWIFS